MPHVVVDADLEHKMQSPVFRPYNRRHDYQAGLLREDIMSPFPRLFQLVIYPPTEPQDALNAVDTTLKY